MAAISEVMTALKQARTTDVKAASVAASQHEFR